MLRDVSSAMRAAESETALQRGTSTLRAAVDASRSPRSDSDGFSDERETKGIQVKRNLVFIALLAAAPVHAADVDLAPYGYVSDVMRSAKSPAQAQNESKAVATADEATVGEAGVRFAVEPSTKSRAQVAAETREAARFGLLTRGEADPVQPTAEQERQIRAAGLRALGIDAAAR
jgi:hypothetical protein